MIKHKFESLEVKKKAKFCKKLSVKSEIDIENKMKCGKLKTHDELIFNGSVKCYGNVTSNTSAILSSTVITGQLNINNITTTGPVTCNNTITVNDSTIVKNPLNYLINQSNIFTIFQTSSITLPPGTDGLTLYVISTINGSSRTIKTTGGDSIGGNWYYSGGIENISVSPISIFEWNNTVGDIFKFTYIDGTYYMEAFTVNPYI